MASSILSRNSSLQAQSLSKADVLQWFSDVLLLNVTKLEQVRQLCVWRHSHLTCCGLPKYRGCAVAKWSLLLSGAGRF